VSQFVCRVPVHAVSCEPEPSRLVARRFEYVRVVD
jgi:hypothetical protein